MRSKKPISSFAPPEVWRFILPLTVASICIVAGVIVENTLNRSSTDFSLIAYGSIVIVYTLVNHALIARTISFRETYGLLNSVLSGIGLGLLTYFLPDHLNEVSHVLIIFGVVAVAIVSGRRYFYLSLFLILAVSLPLDRRPDVLVRVTFHPNPILARRGGRGNRGSVSLRHQMPL